MDEYGKYLMNVLQLWTCEYNVLFHPNFSVFKHNRTAVWSVTICYTLYTHTKRGYNLWMLKNL